MCVADGCCCSACCYSLCCEFFCDWLDEAAVDFRVDDTFLSRTATAVFGLGSSLYDHNYNAVAKRVSRRQHTSGLQSSQMFSD